MVLAALLIAACSGGHPSTGGRAAGRTRAPRITSGGYEVPQPLARAAAGTLIASRVAPSQARRLGAGRAWRVLYHSTDLSDRDIAVSGLVLLPEGRAPARMADRRMGARHDRPRRPVRAVDRSRPRARCERGARGERVARAGPCRCRQRLPGTRYTRRAPVSHRRSRRERSDRQRRRGAIAPRLARVERVDHRRSLGRRPNRAVRRADGPATSTPIDVPRHGRIGTRVHARGAHRVHRSHAGSRPAGVSHVHARRVELGRPRRPRRFPAHGPSPTLPRGRDQDLRRRHHTRVRGAPCRPSARGRCRDQGSPRRRARPLRKPRPEAGIRADPDHAGHRRRGRPLHRDRQDGHAVVRARRRRSVPPVWRPRPQHAHRGIPGDDPHLDRATVLARSSALHVPRPHPRRSAVDTETRIRHHVAISTRFRRDCRWRCRSSSPVIATCAAGCVRSPPVRRRRASSRDR